ncbi:MAG: hypothetical protein HRU41_02780 [Saprospiraceae bacterium]|nr:hypothetical protein [Saprospiraceae bacterium]
MSNTPPPFPEPPGQMMRVLRWFCADVYLEEVEGDLFELFQEEVEEYGLKRARRRFFFIALLTVSYQAIRAALANPVQALRSE